jgi:dynein heavy chain
MLRSYHDELSELKLVEKKHLLKQSLESLNDAMKIGIDSLNWNSLGIDEFINTCNKKLTYFS